MYFVRIQATAQNSFHIKNSDNIIVINNRLTAKRHYCSFCSIWWSYLYYNIFLAVQSMPLKHRGKIKKNQTYLLYIYEYLTRYRRCTARWTTANVDTKKLRCSSFHRVSIINNMHQNCILYNINNRCRHKILCSMKL